ncbi:MAG: hypothetical protein ACRCWG_15850 [Sarcina sp.]
MKVEMNLYDITEEVEFYKLKEMLFCMESLSCDDKELVELIRQNDGLLKYFDKIKEEYGIFQTKERAEYERNKRKS